MTERSRHGDLTPPVTDIAGPLVYSARGLAYLDMAAKRLHAIEREGEGYWDWQGAHTAAWRVYRAVFLHEHGCPPGPGVRRRPDGTFAAKVLPIRDSRGGPGMLRAGTPGTLAVVEHFAYPRRAHISTDYGATWQTRKVPDGVDSGGSLPDWRSWPPN